jgi:triphosphoribosyl-dephospho-CoA synthase
MSTAGLRPEALPIGLCAQVACVWEVTARKPGNVHRFQDFADAGYSDFVLSAAAVAPVMDRAQGRSVGPTVLACVEATRRLVRSNTNLGIILLLAPLAAVPPDVGLRAGLPGVLERLDIDDARAVYRAIRMAAPGGLGCVRDQDVADEPTRSLVQIMALAAERDLVARQYAGGFREVLETGVPALHDGLERCASVEGAIVFCHLRLMARFPDSLIARKCGAAEAAEAARRAEGVLRAGWPHTATGRSACADLDRWLRTEGHRRNPGTTADLVTASLFVALREGSMELPLRLPWSCGWDHA